MRGVEVERYRTVWANGSALSYGCEYGVAHSQLLIRSLRRLLARERSTLHFHGPPDTLAIVGFLASGSAHTVVYDMHDSGPELFDAKFGPGPATHALRAAQRAAIRCADGVIVTNETQRELVATSSRQTAKAVAIVRNGPRLSEFPTPPNARTGTLGAPELVYVGTLDVQDGVLELPALLRRPALADARLTVVGAGAAHDALIARCREAGVEHRVRLTGRVPHDRVAKLIAEADIAIDPAPGTTLNHGSTMIKIAEYMASGRPVVAYDLHETRRTAGDTALYAPCEDQSAFAQLVGDLARDGERRLQLGREARRRSLSLTWEHSREVLLDFYDRLVRTRR